MLTIELLTNLFQEKLGAQYKVCANDAFERAFTTPAVTPYGTQYDVNYQAFDELADKIVAVLAANDMALYNVPYKFFQGTYTLSFWVPVDCNKVDAEGRFLEVPKFDFYADAEALITALKAVTEITDGSNTYKAFFTASEPKLLSTAPENTGAYKRVVYQIVGNVSISAAGLTTGNDLSVAFIDGSTTKTITNVHNLLISASGTGNVVSFDVDDYTDTANTAAMMVLKDLAFARFSGVARRMKIFKGATELADFYAVVSVKYFVASKTDFGKYTVSAVYSDQYDSVYIRMAFSGDVNTISGIKNFNVDSTTAANLAQEQAALKPGQAVASIGQTVAFEIEDNFDGYNTTNKALKLIYNKAFNNPEELATADSVTDTVQVQIIKNFDTTHVRTFDATVSAQYVKAPSGFGRYIVTLTEA